MTDRMSTAARSALMKRIPREDTTPERALRSELHRRGLRFRKHTKVLPRCAPDVVFPRARVVVMVHGDFWHGYRYATWGQKLTPYWQERIKRNMRRDRRNATRLRRAGWSVMRAWEHQVTADVRRVADRIVRFLAKRVAAGGGHAKAGL